MLDSVWSAMGRPPTAGSRSAGGGQPIGAAQRASRFHVASQVEDERTTGRTEVADVDALRAPDAGPSDQRLVDVAVQQHPRAVAPHGLEQRPAATLQAPGAYVVRQPGQRG